MQIGRGLSLLAAALALSACAQGGGAGGSGHLSMEYVQRYAGVNPTPASFTQCHGFGCAVTSNVSLNAQAWRRVEAVFHPRPGSAAAERQRIARAVVLMQRLVGAQTGTAVHQWTHQNLYIKPNFGDTSQLDCIDEAVNTWTYLTLMERGHLLHFHRVAELAFAGLPSDTNPRNTAVIQDKTTGEYFAIDPSLVDYNVPPPIMPLNVWLGAWPPKIAVGKPERHAHKKKG